MEFLHPALAWLLPLAALPILIHLFSLRRVKYVELSTFRFLFDSYQQQRRRLKLIEFLLAALRTAFLLFMIGAISRPTSRQWKFSWIGEGGRDVVFMIDASASMNARHAGRSALDRAKEVAHRLLDRLAPGDRVTLLRVTSRGETLAARFRPDAETLGKQLDQIEVSAMKADWAKAFREIARDGANPIHDPRIFVLTDGQAGAWNDVREQGLDRQLQGKVSLTVINVGDGGPLANRAVVGDPPERHAVVLGLPITLRAKAVHRGAGASVDAPLGFFVDDQEVAKTSVLLQPDETITKEFVYTPRHPGMLRGRFALPADKFPDDDAYYFGLNVLSKIRVLLVNGGPSDDVFEDEPLYLRTALLAAGATVAMPTADRPREAAPPADPATRALAAAVEWREIKEWEFRPRDYQGAQVVILANCGSLAKTQYEQIHQLCQQGTGILVFPGDRVSVDAYNRELTSIATAGSEEPFLNFTLERATGSIHDLQGAERIGGLNLAHPILAVFADGKDRPFSTARFWRRYPIKFTGSRGTAAALLEFANGDPALVEARVGNGVVLFAAFPLHARWSNLPLKPEFVPLVLRMIGHAAGMLAPRLTPAVNAGGTAEIRLAGTWTSPTGKHLDPEGRASVLNFQGVNAAGVAPIENTSVRGIHTVEVTAGPPEEPVTTRLAFGVNLDPEESDFRRVAPATWQEWFPSLDVTVLDAAAVLDPLADTGAGGEFWRSLVILAAAVLGLEMLLFTMGSSAGAKPGTVTNRFGWLGGRWIGRLTGDETVET